MDIAERDENVICGLLPNGFHLTYAVPKGVGEYGRYVVEWVGKEDLPRRSITVHENVRIIILGYEEKGSFRAKPAEPWSACLVKFL